MKRRKLFATFETMFVHGAFVFRQEMTGNRIQQHHSVAAFFQELGIKFAALQSEVRREVIRLPLIDIYHQAFAAVAAGSAVDLRRDLCIEFADEHIDLGFVMGGKKAPEAIIFRLFCMGE